MRRIISRTETNDSGVSGSPSMAVTVASTGVSGRAELVGEGGEEAVLGEVGGLGFGASGLFAKHADAFLRGSFLESDVTEDKDPARRMGTVAERGDPRVEGGRRSGFGAIEHECCRGRGLRFRSGALSGRASA